jgi:hypothetical protein
MVMVLLTNRVLCSKKQDDLCSLFFSNIAASIAMIADELLQYLNANAIRLLLVIEYGE